MSESSRTDREILDELLAGKNLLYKKFEQLGEKFDDLSEQVGVEGYRYSTLQFNLQKQVDEINSLMGRGFSFGK